MSLEEIAAHFGVARSMLCSFIKRRQICNMEDRRKFICIQKSIGKLEAIE